MKILKLLVLSLVIWGGFGVFNVTYAFSDLNVGDDSYVEVNFLQERGVIDGYPDGSFRPNNFLNRAELTKIVVEAQDMEIVSDLNCFPDVRETDWFAPYVCTALNEGVLEGYPDGTFKPANTVNRAEMVKIVAEAVNVGDFNLVGFSDVEGGEWYAPFVFDMFGANFLPYKGSFQASRDVTRADFADVYYRYLNAGTDGVYGDLSGEYMLDFEVPSELIMNEIYILSGLSLVDDFDVEIDFGDGQVFENSFSSGERFQFSLVFFNEGSYELSLGGEVFEVKVSDDYLVDESFDNLDSVEGESFVSVDFLDSKYEELTILFNADVSSDDLIFKYEFDFDGDSVSFYNRQMLDVLSIDSELFLKSWGGEEDISYKFSVANFASTKRSEFVELVNESIEVVPKFETKFNNVDFVDFDFVFGELDPVEVVFDPNKNVSELLLVIDDDFELSDVEGAVLRQGDNWVLRYSPSLDNEFLILEVNDDEGRALVNYPVYKRNVLPLLPDPFFVNEDDFVEATVANALSLLNKDRVQFDLEPLVLDTDLTLLAEAHLQDMLDNDFVAHEGSDGRTVDVRKLDFGIKSFVSENIARDLDLASAQSALMRSASHRVNILNPSWDKVGFAVFEDTKKGATYLVQNFGIDEELIVGFLDDVIEESLVVNRDERLEGVVDEWVNLMKSNASFEKEINGERLIDKVSDLGFYTNGVTITGRGVVIDEAKELVKENLGEIDVQDFDKYITGSALGSDGIIYYAVVLVR